MAKQRRLFSSAGGDNLQELKLKIRGLYTHPSELSAAPDGALSKADDIVIDREDVAEPRRGLNRSNGGFSDASYRANKLYFYQNYLIAHYSTNLMAYYSTVVDSSSANVSGSGSWTAISGTYTPPTGAKVRFAEANKNLFFTTNAGVQKMDAYNDTPGLAGAYKGLDLYVAIVDITGNWLTTSYYTAYRIVWGYRDANNNLILGAPSNRARLYNSDPADRAVTVTATIPTGVTTSWFYQVYRAASSNAEASDEMGLVYEDNPSSADITNGYIQFNDITPDALRGATLYTSATQEGIAAGNEQPPIAEDIAVYKESMFYANTTSKQRKYVNLLGIGTGGLAANDTFVVRDSSNNSCTLTAKSTTTFGSEDFANRYFAHESGAGSASANIRNTAISLTRVINRGYVQTTASTTSGLTTITVSSASNLILGMYVSGTGIASSAYITGISGTTITLNEAASATGVGVTVTFKLPVYAYYLSSNDDLPGKLLIEERGLGGNAFKLYGNNSSAWSPNINDVVESSNDRYKNALYYSKTSQPEAVPLANYFFCGSAEKEILRILPLRDSLFILKEDGIYRLSGDNAASFRVDLFDSTTRLIAPESAVVLNNQIWALTDQGVVSITESGVQVRSRPIEYTLTSLQGVNLSVLQSASFGVAYETERKYLLFVPADSGDTSPTQAFVYNLFTNTWTRWVLSKTAGIVHQTDGKLYLGSGTENYINQERKSYTFRDFVDYGFTATISAWDSSTKVLTINSTDQMAVGDIIYQSDTIYSTIESIDTTAGTATMSFTAGFTAGSATIYKAISSKIAWVPLTGSNPAALKHIRECTLLFKRDYTGTGTIRFTSDVSLAPEDETVDGTPIGLWGLFAWGSVPWGGENRRRPIRVLVPRNMQRCTQLTIEFQHSTGYAAYQLNGVSVVGNFGSERVAY